MEGIGTAPSYPPQLSCTNQHTETVEVIDFGDDERQQVLRAYREEELRWKPWLIPEEELPPVALLRPSRSPSPPREDYLSPAACLAGMWGEEEEPVPTVNAAALAAAPRRKRRLRRHRSTRHSEVSDNVLLPLNPPGCDEGEGLRRTIKVSEMETQRICTVNSVTPPCTSSQSVFSGASGDAVCSMPLTLNVEGVTLVPTICIDNKAKISDIGHAILGEDTLPSQNGENDTAKPTIDSSVLIIKPSDVEAVVTQPAPALVPATRVRAAVSQPSHAPVSTPQVGVAAARFFPAPRRLHQLMFPLEAQEGHRRHDSLLFSSLSS
ncbi:uncharacterized protein LOC112842161 [Oreochromis niloticus]|uniref:uncharacterized protein LOC112842161 n=1 Tax=Oreochromis niloticus TaxID=8128 RepID=UPI000DF2329D|nr:uncharacterized protein LOC112842161 [Oreochromis niloticus]